MSTERLPQKGEIIAGKFQVESTLGAGGMGVVVAARDLALRRRVAVKFLAPHVAEVPEASARFLREARAAVAIQSEHVARVIDMGETPGGAPFLVMEFLAGTDFSKVLKQRGPLPIAEAIDYMLQAGEAIAEAHALGIVHRDLKPANLFLTARAEGSPLVKVLDFGLSKVVIQGEDALDASLTATGAIIGSPFYMSPEQVRCHPDVDGRADVWSLGVILYEMLTGKKPFEGPTLPAVAAKIVADTPVSMRSLRPEIPEALERAVMACLAKSADARSRSVSELAQALAPFAAPTSLGSVTRIARFAPSPAEAEISSEPIAPRTLVMAPAPPAPPVLAQQPAPAHAPPPPIAPPMVDVAPPDPGMHNTGQASAWGQSNAHVARPARPNRAPVAFVVATMVVLFGVAIWALRSNRGVARMAATAPLPPVESLASVAETANLPAPPVSAPVSAPRSPPAVSATPAASVAAPPDVPSAAEDVKAAAPPAAVKPGKAVTTGDGPKAKPVKVRKRDPFANPN